MFCSLSSSQPWAKCLSQSGTPKISVEWMAKDQNLSDQLNLFRPGIEGNKETIVGTQWYCWFSMPLLSAFALWVSRSTWFSQSSVLWLWRPDESWTSLCFKYCDRRKIDQSHTRTNGTRNVFDSLDQHPSLFLPPIAPAGWSCQGDLHGLVPE